MFGGRLGAGELVIILVILLLIIGPRRLPELARSIGRSLREFRGGLKDAAEEREERSPKPDRRDEERS